MTDRRRAAGRGWQLGGATAGVVAALAYLRVADPHDPAALMPRCPTKRITGLDCPACGGLRLVHDLLHGDLRAAADDNLFLLVCSPVLVALVVRQARSWRRGEDAPVPAGVAGGLGGAALAWMVVRNWPGWPLRPQAPLGPTAASRNAR